MRWCPALRPDEDVAIAVLNAHQWGLTDCTGLVTGMGHDDYWQPCITQGGAFGTTATFVKIDLLAHPVLELGTYFAMGPTSIEERLIYVSKDSSMLGLKWRQAAGSFVTATSSMPPS